jgi:hypothetical protein
MVTNRKGGIVGRAYGWLFSFSWGLNFAWEMTHSFLYRDVPPFLGHLPFLFVAAVGDAAITLALVGLVALILKDRLWFVQRAAGSLAILAAASIAASVFVEYLNVEVLQRWQYTEEMPRMPLFPVGWSPFLQVALIPTVSAVLASLRFRGDSFAP